MVDIINRFYQDGVTKELIKDGDEYKIIRKDGKYKFVDNLGKISEDEAEGKFYYGWINEKKTVWYTFSPR